MILAFNKWETTGITVTDEGLKRYVSLEPRIVPRSGGIHAHKRFYKSKYFIIERLMNKIFVPGHKGKKHNKTSGRATGTAVNAYKTVYQSLEILEKKTGKNPIEAFVRALENAAPREEIIAIEYGGARYPKAVECSPQRRIDLTLRWFIQGAYSRSFNTKTTFTQALAGELYDAYTLSTKSNAITKKFDLERQADSSR